MWRNWSGEQVCMPARRAVPRSTAEVVEAVQRAGALDEVVRVAGAGHSFTDVVPTTGTLLSLRRMDRVLDADPASGLVRVQAGIGIGALAEELARLGLAFENLGDIDVQSIAGAISTATHGTGAALGNLSSQVAALQLVDGGGQVRELEGGDDLRAARVALGALGVITEVTLRAVPAYTLRGIDEPRPLADVLERLDELADASRHFEFFVFPHTNVAFTKTNEVVADAPRPRRGRRFLEEVVLENAVLGAGSRLVRRLPPAAPAFNRALAAGMSRRVRVDRAHRIFTTSRLVRFVEMEYAYPRAAAATVVRAVLEVAARFPVSFPIEVRFVAADDAHLSPAVGRDTVYVAVHVYRGTAWEPYFRAVEAIADEHGGRPHWGKRHFQTAATLAPRYPGWDAFRGVRARLDPHGRFANDHIGRVLGPVGGGDGVALGPPSR